MEQHERNPDQNSQTITWEFRERETGAWQALQWILHTDEPGWTCYRRITNAIEWAHAPEYDRDTDAEVLALIGRLQREEAALRRDKDEGNSG